MVGVPAGGVSAAQPGDEEGVAGRRERTRQRKEKRAQNTTREGGRFK